MKNDGEVIFRTEYGTVDVDEDLSAFLVLLEFNKPEARGGWADETKSETGEPLVDELEAAEGSTGSFDELAAYEVDGRSDRMQTSVSV